jgi:hypothetical protein
MSFKLLVPDKQSWFLGDLTFTNRPPVNTETGGAAAAAVVGLQESAPEIESNPHPEIEEAIDRLPEASRKELYALLRNVVPRKKPVRVQPKVSDVPVDLHLEHHKEPVRVAAHPEWTKFQENSVGNLNRQKRLEIAKQYLAEHQGK